MECIRLLMDLSNKDVEEKIFIDLVSFLAIIFIHFLIFAQKMGGKSAKARICHLCEIVNY